MLNSNIIMEGLIKVITKFAMKNNVNYMIISLMSPKTMEGLIKLSTKFAIKIFSNCMNVSLVDCKHRGFHRIQKLMCCRLHAPVCFANHEQDSPVQQCPADCPGGDHITWEDTDLIDVEQPL